jgi:DNA-binding CsgD family transcriptional regulator
MTLPSRNGALTGQNRSTTTPSVDVKLLPRPTFPTDGPNAPRARRVSGPVRGESGLSALIGEIYDTTMDPTLWPGLLRQIGDFTGGTAVCLHTRDAMDIRWYACGRSDPDYDRLYLDEFIKIDPVSARFRTAEIGRPVGIADVMDLDAYLASRFYREWAYPQGLADIMALRLDRSATTGAVLVVYRYERNGLADEEMRRRALLIGPHLQRAALVGRSLEHKTTEAATLTDTIDGLRAAVLFVDADGRVVHANAAAQGMLRECLALRTVSGRLSAADARISPALLEAVAAAKGGDAALGGRGIAMPLTARDGERYVVHTLPLTSAERRGAQGRLGAVAALIVQKAALDLGTMTSPIAKAFGLTPTELRVLVAIVETGGVRETAEAMGISQATVKTHLHRLFAKTDTRRQADLVKLAAGFASPLAD